MNIDVAKKGNETILWLVDQQNSGQRTQYLACGCSRMASVGQNSDIEPRDGWQHKPARKAVRWKLRYPNQASVIIGTDVHRKRFMSLKDSKCDEKWVRAHAENHVLVQPETGTELQVGSFLTDRSECDPRSYRVRVEMIVTRLADLPDIRSAASYYRAAGRLFGAGSSAPQAIALERLSADMKLYPGAILPVEVDTDRVPGVLLLTDNESPSTMWNASLHLLRSTDKLRGQVLWTSPRTVDARQG